MSSAERLKGSGLLADFGVGRFFAITALLVIAVALESTLLTRATLLGVVPQLVFVVIISLAYLDGEHVGAVTGFAGGLLQDLLLPGSIVGLTALVYTMLGYGVGSFRKYAPSDSVWLPVFAVALGSFLAEAGYALLAIILGEQWIGLRLTAQVIGLVVLYNTLLTPFVFPLTRKVADRFRPERVYRW